jgi:hypothetical protein
LGIDGTCFLVEGLFCLKETPQSGDLALKFGVERQETPKTQSQGVFWETKGNQLGF